MDAKNGVEAGKNLLEVLNSVEISEISSKTSLDSQVLSKLFLPSGAVTGIGSVPFSNAEEAVDFVEEVCREIPFWPKPVQGFPCGAMVEQLIVPIRHFLEHANGSTPGYRVISGQLDALLQVMTVSNVELDAASAPGFFAFEKALQDGRFASAIALKGQTTGPITLAANLFNGKTTFLEDAALRGAVASFVSRLALWQVKRLQKWGKPVILFLNEPYLATIKGEQVEWASALLQTVLSAVKAAGAVTVVHSCAAPPVFTVLGETRPDLVSFDASQDMEKFLANPEAHAYIQSGGGVAFGISPKLEASSSMDIMPLYLRWVMSIPRDLSTRDLAQRSIVAVTCGLSALDEAGARHAFTLASKFGQRIKTLAERELLLDD